MVGLLVLEVGRGRTPTTNRLQSIFLFGFCVDMLVVLSIAVIMSHLAHHKKVHKRAKQDQAKINHSVYGNFG